MRRTLEPAATRPRATGNEYTIVELPSGAGSSK